MKKFLYWIPRILGILFILFLGLFALDVFVPGAPFTYMIVGFLIHLIPNFILSAVLIFAWRNELVGGLSFLLLFVVAILFFRAELAGFILFSPLILIGSLFILDHFSLKRKVSAPKLSSSR
jgi:hypothetical protein